MKSDKKRGSLSENGAVASEAFQDFFFFRRNLARYSYVYRKKSDNIRQSTKYLVPDRSKLQLENILSGFLFPYRKWQQLHYGSK